MTLARRLWSRLELIHDVVYFSPAAVERLAAAGFRGYWMGYFAQRAAPLGVTPAAVVTATFYGFAPRRVERAVPDAWSYASPEETLAVRLEAVAAALRDVEVDARTADLAWEVAAAADCAGRALGAANQALPRPDSPVLALWQAAATVREHRGDGHIAVLVARGIAPGEAHAIKVAAGDSDGETLRTTRGFDEDEWSAARDSVVARGWLAPDGTLTDAGRAEHDAVEAATDAAASAPWTAVGDAHAQELLTALDPVVRAVRALGVVPEPSPLGFTWDE